MNIFVLSEDPAKAARMACDKHVVKMPTETAQMLSTVLSLHGVNIGYKPTHAGHPCTKWVGDTLANFRWTVQYGLALCAEYTFRYHRRHKAEGVIRAAARRRLKGSDVLTPFAQAMPEMYQGVNAVKAYRRFYSGEKRRFARWDRGRAAPKWWKRDG